MGTPQIILLVLYGASLLLQAHDHGKPKEGNHNFWHTLTSAVITFLLLDWGGFFE
ncbi:hypothetical protein [Chryseobacterium sp. IHB B 17019]|uniref:hypothetical protein n=1 Tax=Chryseobacterium sp. IHB B 17019 TaxID=1721091 RepID=UPI000A3EFF09|nr:hypothetical protein [Chryseobacterium sp. IHB B 17019]